MKLFVFEGARKETRLFATLQYLFLGGPCDQRICCVYGQNIYHLYREMTQDECEEDGDNALSLVSVLQNRVVDGHPVLSKSYLQSEFSEIYLFFDYDAHHSDKGGATSIDDNHARIEQMLRFFADETEMGKLYVSYPMIEAFRYAKKLPDPDYLHYLIPQAEWQRLKTIVALSPYIKDEALIAMEFPLDGDKVEFLRKKWNCCVCQNVTQASALTSGLAVVPENKDLISPTMIFEAQVRLFKKKASVVPLFSFALFLFDYMKPGILNARPFTGGL